MSDCHGATECGCHECTHHGDAMTEPGTFVLFQDMWRPHWWRIWHALTCGGMHLCWTPKDHLTAPASVGRCVRCGEIIVATVIAE